jgi:periplasmic divalent cation tolerance protein
MAADAGVVVALSTAPDAEVGARIARALVESGAVACVNLVPGVRSIYVWDGAVQDEAEVLLVIKTTAAGAPRAEAALRAAHPYAVPEWVLLPVAGGFSGYLDWVRANVGRGD